MVVEDWPAICTEWNMCRIRSRYRLMWCRERTSRKHRLAIVITLLNVIVFRIVLLRMRTRREEVAILGLNSRSAFVHEVEHYRAHLEMGVSADKSIMHDSM